MAFEALAGKTGAFRRSGGDWDDACRGIEGLVSSALGIELSDLRGRTRRAPAAFARQAAMYLAHVKLGLNLSDVGAYFGRDRTTVAYACARMEDSRDDPRLECVLECVETALDHWRTTGMAPGARP